VVVIAKIAVVMFNLIYCFFKFLPLKKRIVFISRQGNSKSDDIILLEKELKKRNKDIDVVVLCKKIESGLKNKLNYLFHMFIQMYYLATSKIIVLDGYCILASILKKRKGSIIVQMWHAMGAFKKFGYSILDQDEGTKKSFALAMKMHNNYDYIFTSSDDTKKYFAEAFNYSVDQLMTMPLPRVDYLTDEKYIKKVRSKVIKTYPFFKKKKTIVYVPTFRKAGDDINPINELIRSVDYSKYNLVVKLHPLSNLDIDDKRVIVDKKFSSIDMMISSDYIITDYSAIVFEASILEKPLFFYCYDYDQYFQKRNFYLDYKKEMPGIIKTDAKKIVEAIEDENYDLEKIKKFGRKYVSYEKGKCTSNLVDFIFSIM